MLISLYCAMRWEDHVWLGYGLAGFFAGIAFLVKQPGLAAALAVFIVLLPHREFKKAAVLTITTVLPVAITFLILYWRRDPFIDQITGVGKNLWSFRDGARYVIDHLLVARWIIPMAIGAMGFAQAVRLGSKAKLIASFILVNWVVGFAGIAQIGGYLNYFLPGLAGCALLLPYAIQFFQQHVRLKASLAFACAGLLWATTNAYSYAKGQSKYFPAPTTDSLTWLRPYRILSDLSTINDARARADAARSPDCPHDGTDRELGWHSRAGESAAWRLRSDHSHPGESESPHARLPRGFPLQPGASQDHEREIRDFVFDGQVDGFEAARARGGSDTGDVYADVAGAMLDLPAIAAHGPEA